MFLNLVLEMLAINLASGLNQTKVLWKLHLSFLERMEKFENEAEVSIK